MNKELILAIEALEKENGIDKEIMFDAIEKSLMDEYKAEFHNPAIIWLIQFNLIFDHHKLFYAIIPEQRRVPQ